MKDITLPLYAVTKVVGLEKTESTLSVACALAQTGETAGTLILTCEQTHTFSGPRGAVTSGEGGVYFTLLLPAQNEAEKVGLALANAIGYTVEHALELNTKLVPGGVAVWDKKSHKWKQFADVTCTADGEHLFLSAGILLNNPAPRFLVSSHTDLKRLLKSETSKELFLDAVLDTFWKYYSFLKH